MGGCRRLSEAVNRRTNPCLGVCSVAPPRGRPGRPGTSPGRRALGGRDRCPAVARPWSPPVRERHRIATATAHLTFRHSRPEAEDAGLAGPLTDPVRVAAKHRWFLATHRPAEDGSSARESP
ncbi:MAG: hypothetical protein AVDCRST_MAG73-3730 [uncultured Thermomicrobiales bacterium]|uniref:Uncharacterized protein n=1 Tax=uncultured Thermomicrobiales bacterium TaxID=1645740 RepID=A0A6J4UV13_9BACT|nr:MAG: hypothetical protein AVDCRST_MAG73-3730 [uncultured Thermomicrobiales bacterium]